MVKVSDLEHSYNISSILNRGVTWVSRLGGCELILPDERAWLKMPRPHLVDISHK